MWSFLPSRSVRVQPVAIRDSFAAKGFRPSRVMLNMKPMAMLDPDTAPEACDDEALMRRIALRDEQAFAEILDRHAALPHRVAWRMLGNGTEAEDVAQEAMLRLWQNAQTWRGEGPGVAAWLRRVATNLCLDRLRQRARRALREMLLETDNG